jgi:ADP-heptose:LPS heptosyltransferase
LGDVAMTLPVIYSLAEQYPQLQITVLTRPFFKRIFLNAPSNVEVRTTTAKSVGEVVGLARRLSREGFDAVADFHDVLRSRVMRMVFRLRGLKVATIDKQRRHRRQLTDKKTREFQMSYISRYADVLRRLGLPLASLTFKSLLPESERRGVGIAPFARYATKTYPAELMQQVARRLTDAGHQVYLFGSRGHEAEMLEQWREANPVLTVVAGTMTIEEELAAMSRLQVMLAMDSANMHLASLVATPVVSVWGSTIPQCGFMGYGQSVDNAVWLDLPCQPCSVAGLERCPKSTLECLCALSPERVAERVLALLTRE